MNVRWLGFVVSLVIESRPGTPGSIVALNMFSAAAIGVASYIYVAQNCFARLLQLG